MDKKKLAKKLDTLASNVAKKGIFVVTKQDDLFVVQEHITRRVVDQNIPMRNVAEYLCTLRNKSKTLGVNAKKDLHDLISQYFKYQNDIMFYRHTLKTTKDAIKYDCTEARLHDTLARLSSTRYELQKYR